MKRWLCLLALTMWSAWGWAYTGYQYQGACYQTVEEARKAYYSTFPVSHPPDRIGPVQFYLYAADFTSAPVYGVLKQPPYNDAVYSWSWPTFASCERMDWADGVDLGWKVAAAWVAVWGLMFLARAVYGWGSTEDERHANS